MEPIPARILRPLALACPSAPIPTPRERRTRAYIVEAAERMFAKYGTPRVTMKAFAESCGLSQSTIRRHVCDLHYLFRLVLTAHLDMLLAGISQIPNHHPDRQARARAEYRRLTRDHMGRITPIHALLVRHRFALPDDQLDPVEDQRRMIGVILAGNEWETAFALLDATSIDIGRLEAKFTAEPAQIAKPAAEPAPEAAPETTAPPCRAPFSRYAPTAPPTAPLETILAAQQPPPTPRPQQQAA